MCVTALCDALSPIPPLLVSCPTHDEGLVVTSAFLFAGRSSRCGRIPSLCRPGGDGGVDGLAVPLPAYVQREVLDMWSLTSLVWKVSSWCDCDDGGDDGCGVCDGFSIHSVVGRCQLQRLSPQRCRLPNFLASEFGSDGGDDDDDGSLHKSPSCRLLVSLLSAHPLCPDFATHVWNNAVIWICKHKLNVDN